MKIRNVEFDFNLMRARDMERFETAYTALQEAQKRPEPATASGRMRQTAEELDNFLATVLGEDYDERLDIDAEDMGETRDVFLCLLLEAQRVYDKMEEQNVLFEQQSQAMQQRLAARDARKSGAAVMLPAAQPVSAAPAALPAQAAANAVPEEWAAQAVQAVRENVGQAPAGKHLNRAQRRALARMATSSASSV